MKPIATKRNKHHENKRAAAIMGKHETTITKMTSVAIIKHLYGRIPSVVWWQSTTFVLTGVVILELWVR